MMRIVSAAIVALLFSAPSMGAEKPKAWAEKMKGLEATLRDLLIDLSSDERFASSAGMKRVEKNAEKLAKLAHELKDQKGASPDADPSVQIIAGQFAREADHAYRTLTWGHRDYARDVLKSVTSYCMACHTRTNAGPSFKSGVLAPELQKLKTVERADFLASTRQFDAALAEYEKLAGEPQGPNDNPFEWERAVRSGIALAVRVNRDPDRALKIINQVLASPGAPYFLKDQASHWKQSIADWKAEKPRKDPTEDSLRDEALRLIAAAKGMQRFPADRSADVLYLRASSTVHDLMSLAPQGKHVTEALYLAGMSYEVLNDLNLWDQHEPYYLACILRSPHTELARQCYRQYEQSVYYGYTGSGGTHLPKEVREKLKDLGQLAAPEAEKKGLQ